MISSKHANYNTFSDQTVYENENFQDERQENRLNDNVNSKNCSNIFSFWFIGLCSDFGYWIILTAAHDLLSRGESMVNFTPVPKSPSRRECNQLSAGVILIVNIVPNFIMKSILPFLPLWIHTRIFLAVVLSIAGFAVAASNQMPWYMLSGVALCSIAGGTWTSSFLMYIPMFKDEKIVKAWCSGCGSSGFLASLTYVALTTWEVDLSTILSLMMAIPPLIAVVFWFILDHPNSGYTCYDEVNIDCNHRKRYLEGFYIFLKMICLFTTPYFLVFFCQYLINQGLFELIYIKNSFLDLAAQVRWFNFVYLLAVLLASSSSFLKVDYLWLLVFLQAINLVLMTSETIYGWMGDSVYKFWIVVGLIFWEGLIAGVSYFNTYRRINQEIPENQRQFSMSINSVGASIGMTFAGLIAIPLHNYICSLPLP